MKTFSRRGVDAVVHVHAHARVLVHAHAHAHAHIHMLMHYILTFLCGVGSLVSIYIYICQSDLNAFAYTH